MSFKYICYLLCPAKLSRKFRARAVCHLNNVLEKGWLSISTHQERFWDKIDSHALPKPLKLLKMAEITAAKAFHILIPQARGG